MYEKGERYKGECMMNIEEINQLKMIGTEVRTIERMLFEELPKSVYGKEFCQVYNYLRTEVFATNDVVHVDEAGTVISTTPLLLLKDVCNLSHEEQMSVETLIGCMVTPYKVKDLKEPVQFSFEVTEEDEVYDLSLVTHYEEGVFFTENEEELAFVRTFNEDNEEREWLKEYILLPIRSKHACVTALYTFFKREHSLDSLKLPQLEGNVSLTLSNTGIEEVQLNTIGDSEDDMAAFFNFELPIITIKRSELDDLPVLAEKYEDIDIRLLKDYQYVLKEFMALPFLEQKNLDYVKKNMVERLSTMDD